MSDELQIITTNAASDGWVDGIPGAVSTGYQAQNTVLQALFNGLDKSSVRIDGANLKIDPSGVIDDSGLPFVVSTLITIALPTTGAANWYLKVVAGSTALERSIEFDDDRGTYDAAKNGFYNTGGERVLNWCYNRFSAQLVRLPDSDKRDGDYSYRQDLNGLFSGNNYAEWGTCAYTLATPIISAASVLHDSSNGRYYVLSTYKSVPLGNEDSTKLEIYDNDFSLLSTINNTAIIRISGAVDIANSKLVIGRGTTVNICTGINLTVGSTITAYAADICIDNDGNLIGCDGTTSNIYCYTGITATLADTLVAPGVVKGLGIDRYSGNILASCEDGASNKKLTVIDRTTGAIIAEIASLTNADLHHGIQNVPTSGGLLYVITGDSDFPDWSKGTLYYRGRKG